MKRRGAHKVADDVRTTIACAVEDDQILFVDADLRIGEGFCEIIAMGEPKSLPRTFDPNSPNDDQRDLDDLQLADEIASAVRWIGRPVHYVGLSTYGTVDVQSQNVRYAFGSWKRRRAAGNYRVSPLPDKISRAAGIPRKHILIDNDATAAALGEWSFGTGRLTQAFAYIWAGRGINVGLVLDGIPWEGVLHPEAGHILPRRHPSEPRLRGGCADHEGCIIGLASLRAINRRRENGQSLAEISDIISFYFAQLCMDICLMVAPEKIAMGGLLFGRCRIPGLIDNTVKQFETLIGRYPRYVHQSKSNFIVEASISPTAALCGMIEMVRQELNNG